MINIYLRVVNSGCYFGTDGNTDLFLRTLAATRRMGYKKNDICTKGCPFFFSHPVCSMYKKLCIHKLVYIL